MDITLPPNIISGFALYSIALSILIISRRKLSVVYFLSCSAILLLHNVLLDIQNVISAILVWSALLLPTLTYYQSRKIRQLSMVILGLFSLMLALHWIPGFNKQIIFEARLLPAASLPYELKANMDKALAALILLNAFRFTRTPPQWLPLNDHELRIAFLGITFILSLAYVMGCSFMPKWGELTLVFLFFNLCVTCVAEEVFFRLVIQDALTKKFKKPDTRHSPSFLINTLPIVITASLFTLAHFHTGEGAIQRLFLIFLAGILYATIYQQRRNLSASVLTHFILNFIHFCFFVYPASFN